MATANPFDPYQSPEYRQSNLYAGGYIPQPWAQSHTDDPSGGIGVPLPDTGIPQAQTQQQPTRYQQIVDAYNTYIGRTPSQQEVYSHVGAGSWAENDPRIYQSISNIIHSPEAQAYASGKPPRPPTGRVIRHSRGIGVRPPLPAAALAADA